MRIFATLYSLTFCGVALWAWAAHVFYGGTAREHLLPGVILHIVALPSSLLIEKLAEHVSWVLNSPITMLSLVTGLGFFQVAVMWLLAGRCSFSGS